MLELAGAVIFIAIFLGGMYWHEIREFDGWR